MAGLYIHIPFCAQACHYCDFHFSTSQQKRKELIHSLGKEILLQKDYLGNEAIRTMYFGGGTPSLLSFEELSHLIEVTRSIHDFTDLSEVTLEANPEDLTDRRLMELKEAGITRLSIGLQSFQDSMLRFLNRCHTASTGIEAFHRARTAGFANINIDLIYAIPGLDLPQWEDNIGQAIELNAEHISSYSLTIEPRTVFGRWATKGKFTAVSDDMAAIQMELLINYLEDAGYQQYEISNFSKPGRQALHNSGYWNNQNYLGIGPSAHSYNGASRQFNVSNNHIYVRSIQEEKIPFEYEQLSRNDKINEYILTSLRTIKGCDLIRLKILFDFDLMHERKNYLDTIVEKGLAAIHSETLTLTRKGRLLADKIASDLFEVHPD
ncbi:MAG TPA: radical SAM family heme chaperone HemW [Cyclobacteriaceae bacterium]|nr:radical SAM family heme chaperone HemW [Cyclobacteriaceae bacterium]